MKIIKFHKQWGGTNKKKAVRTLNGKTYDEMPVADHMELITY